MKKLSCLMICLTMAGMLSTTSALAAATSTSTTTQMTTTLNSLQGATSTTGDDSTDTTDSDATDSGSSLTLANDLEIAGGALGAAAVITGVAVGVTKANSSSSSLDDWDPILDDINEFNTPPPAAVTDVVTQTTEQEVADGASDLAGSIGAALESGLSDIA